MIFIVFEYVLPKQKLLLIMRKCQKFPLKLVVKSALLAAILKNQLYFVSVVIQIFRIRSAVQHCTCNPLSQNTIAHNLLLRLLWMVSFVWDAKVIKHFLLLVRSSVNCYLQILLSTSPPK